MSRIGRMSAALLLALGFSETASAVPHVYQVAAGGALNVVLPAYRSASPIEVALEGGYVTYDAETGVLSSVELEVGGGRTIFLDGSVFGPSPTGLANGMAFRFEVPRILSMDLKFAAKQMGTNDLPPLPTPGPTPGAAGPAVPEPTAALLFGAGMLVAGRRRVFGFGR